MSRTLHLLAEAVTHGQLLLWTPDGRRRRHVGAAAGPTVRVRVHDRHLAGRLLRGGAAALGASFVEGGWSTDDLAATLGMLSAAVDSRVRSTWGQRVQAIGGAVFQRARDLVVEHATVPTMADHYNLGNDFYAAWLDDTMTYSSALFDGRVTASGRDDHGSSLPPSSRPATDRALARAQRAKYARILDQLDVGPGDRVLEIGFGWGGFAHVAAERGVHVTGVTIAREQLDFAGKRLAEAGLSDHVDLRLLDFAWIPRELPDRVFDGVVSIEMIESIPQARWPELFDVTARALRPGARAVYQVIVIADDLFDTYADREDFITTWIFPGGRLPAPRVLDVLASDAGLAVEDVTTFGRAYATTLATWWRRFDAVFDDRVRDLGFDDRFRRMWHYYLAYCQAGFENGRIDVGQWTWTRPGERRPPLASR